MAEAAIRFDRNTTIDAPAADACDPRVTTDDRGVVVTIYGRPFELSEGAARALAWALVSAIEDIDRRRRC